MRLKLILLSVSIGIFIYAVSSHFSLAAPKMTPYLQAVTANSIYVLVESDSTDPVTVRYGESTDCNLQTNSEKVEPTTASPVTFVHKIKLTGLKPDTLYHYSISNGSVYSADYSFWTAANPGTQFRFAWMADCRTGMKIHDDIADLIKSESPRFSLYGGDLCGNSSYQSFKNEFFRTNELALIADVPFFNTPGNHEAWSQNTKAFTEAPDSPSGNQGFYSFDYGDLHVLVLNYMDERHFDEEYQFTKQDLQSSDKTWKIVVCHAPAYCAGGHGEDSHMKTLTKEIFEPAKVNMVISGHSHFYQHNFVNGIHHMIIGTAGGELYQPQKASYTLKSVKDYNFAIVDVSPSFLHMIVYNNRGQVLDKINLDI